jgi:signal transduction histidine kinase
VRDLIGGVRRVVGRGVDAVRALPTLAVDTVIALACYLLTIATPIVENRADSTFLAFAALACAPLVWRRRFPILVAIVAGVGTIGMARMHQINEVPFSQLVATYTFAAYSSPALRVFGVLGTIAGITVSLLGKDNLLPVGTTVIAFVGAYALGAIARSRRELIATLEARAHQLAADYAEAASRERERIARDMHDILAHSVSLIVVQAEAGPVVVRSDPARAVSVFDAIADAGRDALAQLRRTLGVLRSASASRAPQPGLDALGSLVEQARAAGLVATLHEQGERLPVAPDTAVAAYRVVQEALTNVVKHAHAGQVDVRLNWRPTALRLEVRDDGSGGNGRIRSGGHGLIGMRERVTACGGTLVTGPARDGSGFQVIATLPVVASVTRG